MHWSQCIKARLYQSHTVLKTLLKSLYWPHCNKVTLLKLHCICYTTKDTVLVTVHPNHTVWRLYWSHCIKDTLHWSRRTSKLHCITSHCLKVILCQTALKSQFYQVTTLSKSHCIENTIEVTLYWSHTTSASLCIKVTLHWSIEVTMNRNHTRSVLWKF